MVISKLPISCTQCEFYMHNAYYLEKERLQGVKVQPSAVPHDAHCDEVVGRGHKERRKGLMVVVGEGAHGWRRAINLIFKSEKNNEGRRK